MSDDPILPPLPEPNPDSEEQLADASLEAEITEEAMSDSNDDVVEVENNEAAKCDSSEDSAEEVISDGVEKIPDEEVNSMAAQIEDISERLSILPRTLRNISQKVEAVAHSVSEPRYRDILNNLLSIYDLVGQLAKSSATSGDGSELESRHLRNYETIRTQLFQILTSNGFSEIESQGVFDPELHCALELVQVDDPELNDQIVELVRPGFKNEHRVLRYSDVRVGKYEAPSAPVPPAAD